METPYSNRELDAQHTEVIEYLKRIEAQTMRTNGRVTSLEGWRNRILGGSSMVILIGGAIIGLVIYTFQTARSELKTQISQLQK